MFEINFKLRAKVIFTAENIMQPERFDVFLSYSRNDAEWVKKLANRLEDEGFHVWLDEWILIPGQPWQQGMAQGLDQADCCAICISKQTPSGWFSEEIQRALNRQTQDPSFKVIPLLLPEAKIENIAEFLELRTWVDFRDIADHEYAFYRLGCGLRGVAPGRWPPKKKKRSKVQSGIEGELRELQGYRQNKLIDDEVAMEIQRQLLIRRFIREGEG